MTGAPAFSPTGRFAAITEGLYQVVAALSYRGQVEGRLILLICTRLRRLAARFANIAERVRAGTLRARAPACHRVRPAVDRTAVYGPPAPPPPNKLPSGSAWLLRLAGHNSYKVAAYGSLLQHLLADPEVAALIAAAPQLGRVFRPLCRMLGIDPGPARLPARPRDPEAPRRSRPPRRKQASGQPARVPARSPSTAADNEARARHYPVSLWLRRPA